MTNKQAIEKLTVIANFPALTGEAYEALDLAIKALGDIDDCRNELCLYCGQYKQKHLGACDGCRWRDT